ncbi:MAG: transglutaminase domain-containing protein, partial [Pirellulaceae bacterium]|nr:transglutaminase domain-containing protein [Pirellulaceae bacterium]
DIDAIPTAAQLSKPYTETSGGTNISDYEIAKSLESYLATSPDFSYTLDLNAESVPGLDPIEQFLSVDKRGHCQYFAAALVMMLRSQGIPSRIVVGYKTDEYNELSQQYVARQLHAHAWVEALLDREQLDPNRNIFGQPPSQQYWLRLDPTPSATASANQPSRVTQVLDVAQNAWDDYVVDMDRSRQEASVMGRGLDPMNSSYDRLVAWLSTSVQNLRNGALLSENGRNTSIFSVPAAIFGFILTLIAVVLFRVPLPMWIKRRMQSKRERKTMRPSIDFYARALDQLLRIGITRDASQTPAEVLAEFGARPFELATRKQTGRINETLTFLTQQFYVRRFRNTVSAAEPHSSPLDSKTKIVNSQASGESIDQALRDLSKNIDELIQESSRSKPTK